MKKLIRIAIFRLFGYDINHKSKPIRYTGIWRVEMPDEEPENYPEFLHNLLYSNTK